MKLLRPFKRSRAPSAPLSPPGLPVLREQAETARTFVIPRVQHAGTGQVLALDQVPGRYSRAVLTGGPGSGKTAALNFLGGETRVLSLADFHPLAPPQHFENPSLILLDDVAATRVHAEYLARLLAENGGAQIYLAAENPALLPAEFTRLALLPFHERERNSAVRPWFATRESAREVVAALGRSPRGRRLGFNPLNLFLLIQLYSSRSSLPARRIDLLDAYIAAHLRSEPDPDFALRAMEGIALSTKRGQLAKEEHLARGYGLLREEASGRISFAHTSIHDFLVARALARNPDPAPLLDRLAEENWKQVVLFYVGLAAPESGGIVVQELMEQGRLDLVALAVAETPRGGAYENMREALAARLLPQAWQARDAAALAELAVVEWQGGNDFFAGRLKESDPQARAFAAEALGQLQNDEAVEPLLPLLRDPSAEVRDAAIAALAATGSDLAREPLLAVLRGDNRAIVSDTRMRAAAARALGRLGSESAVPALLVDLRTGDRELRTAAAEALVQIRSDLAREPLRELVQSQVPDEVRAAGQGILDIIG